MPTIATIIPIFSIIALGAFARRWGFIPKSFLEPANRLVYYLAIPAMVFRAIAGASLRRELNPTILLVTLACVLGVGVTVYLGAWLVLLLRFGLTPFGFGGNLHF